MFQKNPVVWKHPRHVVWCGPGVVDQNLNMWNLKSVSNNMTLPIDHRMCKECSWSSGSFADPDTCWSPVSSQNIPPWLYRDTTCPSENACSRFIGTRDLRGFDTFLGSLTKQECETRRRYLFIFIDVMIQWYLISFHHLLVSISGLFLVPIFAGRTLRPGSGVCLPGSKKTPVVEGEWVCDHPMTSGRFTETIRRLWKKDVQRSGKPGGWKTEAFKRNWGKEFFQPTYTKLWIFRIWLFSYFLKPNRLFFLEKREAKKLGLSLEIPEGKSDRPNGRWFT